MKPCKYVRQVNNEYEYGDIFIENAGDKNEKRKYVQAGVRQTLEQALLANQMAEQGAARTGSNHVRPFSWS